MVKTWKRGCFTGGYPWFAFTLSGFTHSEVTVTDKEAKPAPSHHRAAVTLADSGWSLRRQRDVQQRASARYQREGQSIRGKNTQMPDPLETPVLNCHEMIPQDGQKAKCLNKQRERGWRWREGCCEGEEERMERQREGSEGGNDKEGGVGSCWFAPGATEAQSVLYKPQPCQITSASLPAPSPPDTLTDQHTHTHTDTTTQKNWRVCAQTHTNLEKPPCDAFLEPELISTFILQPLWSNFTA